MRFTKLVGRELVERPVPLLTCLLAVTLGVTALVAIRTVTVHSEAAVAVELDRLGANILILPKGVGLQNYYAADAHGETLPEDIVSRIAGSRLQGVDNMSPKLTVSAVVAGRPVPVTGILPKNEFAAKTAWGEAGIFSHPIGCGAGTAPDPDPRSLARKRVIETIGPRELLVGADAAAGFGLAEGGSVVMFGEPFTVRAVLPPTGTVDDGRFFAHLHEVQQLAGRGRVLNVIEIVGCCKQIASGLVDGLVDLLPEAKVVTITQVVQAQQAVNRMMEQLSLLFFVVLLAVGGSALAGTLYANVSERRKEIGTLMALGATPDFVLNLVMAKALVVGVGGGVLGYGLGTAAAIGLGPTLAEVQVRPIFALLFVALSAAITTALAASAWPAWRASRLDPCACFKEV